MTHKINWQKIGYFQNAIHDGLHIAIKTNDTTPKELTNTALNHVKTSDVDAVDIDTARQQIEECISCYLNNGFLVTPLDKVNKSANTNIGYYMDNWKNQLKASKRLKYQRTREGVSRLLFDDLNNIDASTLTNEQRGDYGSLMAVFQKIISQREVSNV